MKIHLLGPSGSGTSTIGKDLSKLYDISYFDSDDIFWKKTDPPFTTKRDILERQKLLEEIVLSKSDWILGGSVLKWGDKILEDSSIVLIYLYIEPKIRIKRLKKREIERFGDRINFGNDMYENHKLFIDWARRYETGDLNMRSMKSEVEWIGRAKGKVIKIDKELSIKDIIEILKYEL